ncbi:MAG: pentapeptide repeat-containing protein [Planctomycetota bacterium]
MTKPKFVDDEAFRSLRTGDAERFHAEMEGRASLDLSDSDLRGSDLRGVDLDRVVLRGAYLRDVDLRGQDLREHDLEGVSLRHAKVSGAWFPDNIDPAEIQASVALGIRLRVRRG